MDQNLTPAQRIIAERAVAASPLAAGEIFSERTVLTPAYPASTESRAGAGAGAGEPAPRSSSAA